MAPITAYFRVISILVNSVYKEETLLDSGFQIISMSRATVDTSKITWNLSIVATTCWNGTRSMLTSEKLLVSYLVVEIIRELNKEPSLYYLLYIYIAPGLYYNNIYLALKFMLLPHVLLLIHMCFS